MTVSNNSRGLSKAGMGENTGKLWFKVTTAENAGSYHVGALRAREISEMSQRGCKGMEVKVKMAAKQGCRTEEKKSVRNGVKK